MFYSQFTSYGFMEYVGEDVEPAPQRHYEALVAQLGNALDLTPGEPNSEDNEAEIFATAYHLAAIEVTLQRAGNQRDVSKVTDLIARREADFLVTPLPTDTLLQRQQRLLALRALPQGATATNISSALLAMLGSAFVRLRVLSLGAGEAAADMPASNFQPLGLVGKWLQLVAPMGLLGSQWASYGNLDPTIPELDELALGDTVTVQGECNTIAEVVTVTGLRTTTSGVPQFQATFAFGHDQAATVTTAPFPRWTSSQAFFLVEVTPAAASNAVVRAQVDAIMQKICRGVTQWATVATVGGLIGPFQNGISPVGTATIGSIPA